MAETKHVLFNPKVRTLDYDPLGRILQSVEEEGWRLLKIVPYNDYQAIAVFERHLHEIDGTSDG